MTGVCGTFGASAPDAEPLAAGLRWSGREYTSSCDRGALSVELATHSATTARPATVDGTVSVWVWGSIRGYEGRDYVPTDPERSAAVCADLYDRYGTGFADRVNGEFVALVHDGAGETLHLVTDRLGSHPLYVAETGDGLMVSTDLQSLARSLDAPVDDRLMAEYLTTGRVSGCTTPFEGIEEVPPGTVDTYVLDGPTRRERYWLPRRRPRAESFSYFVDRFLDTFREVIRDYDRPDASHGLLLSGGSDSRLLLADPPSNPTAYHMSGWMSPEATVAERAAFEAGVPLVWLRREDDHHPRALEANTRMMNFYGRFDQAHTTGFDERLARENDALVSGLYADTMFKGDALSKRSLNVGPLGDLDLPAAKPVDSVDAFLETIDRPLPDFVDASGSVADLVGPDLERTDRGIEYRGAVYPSLTELAACWEFYPMSNDPDLFYYGLTQTMPHWTPFLDDRLVDLSLSMPFRYQLRRNVVNEALDRLAPDLAAIPNARTGVAASRPFPAHYLAARLASLKRRFVPGERPPENHLGHGPWTRIDKLLRSDRFGIETIGKNCETIEALPFLSWDGAVRCYREHMNDGNHHFELYMLLGLLRMPLTEHLAERAGDDRRADGRTDGPGRSDGRSREGGTVGFLDGGH